MSGLEIINEKRRERLLYLITQGNFGGAQTHIAHLASRLYQEFDIHVAMGEKGSLWDKLEDIGVKVYHIPALVRPLSPVKDTNALIQITKLLRKIKPGLISTHSSKAGILGRLAARLCGIPAIFTAHGWSFTEGIPEIQRKIYIHLERFSSRWTERIICVSEYDRELALGYGVGLPEQLITIHNGVPLLSNKYFAKVNLENPIRLIMVARFAEQKDYQLLLKALSEIRINKAFAADLVGDGPLLRSCKDLVRELKLEQKVRFLGERTDIPELLAKAQVFILTSKWEGFSRSVLEAMRAGLPIIASDVGGTREAVIDGQNGYLIPRGDVECLKDRLIKLINNPELRVQMSQSGYDRYLKFFTLQQMLNKTKMIYKELLLKQELSER